MTQKRLAPSKSEFLSTEEKTSLDHMTRREFLGAVPMAATAGYLLVDGALSPARAQGLGVLYAKDLTNPDIPVANAAVTVVKFPLGPTPQQWNGTTDSNGMINLDALPADIKPSSPYGVRPSPNPTDGRVHLVGEDGRVAALDGIVTDLAGRKVSRFMGGEANLSEAPDGVYVARTGEGSWRIVRGDVSRRGFFGKLLSPQDSMTVYAELSHPSYLRSKVFIREGVGGNNHIRHMVPLGIDSFIDQVTRSDNDYVAKWRVNDEHVGLYYDAKKMPKFFLTTNYTSINGPEMPVPETNLALVRELLQNDIWQLTENVIKPGYSGTSGANTTIEEGTVPPNADGFFVVKWSDFITPPTEESLVEIIKDANWRIDNAVVTLPLHSPTLPHVKGLNLQTLLRGLGMGRVLYGYNEESIFYWGLQFISDTPTPNDKAAIRFHTLVSPKNFRAGNMERDYFPMV